jgi:hypothetical protein
VPIVLVTPPAPALEDACTTDVTTAVCVTVAVAVTVCVTVTCEADCGLAVRVAKTVTVRVCGRGVLASAELLMAGAMREDVVETRGEEGVFGRSSSSTLTMGKVVARRAAGRAALSFLGARGSMVGMMVWMVVWKMRCTLL